MAAFRPGVDDAAWLAINAAAFSPTIRSRADSPNETWTRAKAEDWFDSEDFLLLWAETER